MPSNSREKKHLLDPVNLLIVVVAGLVTILPTVGAVLFNHFTEHRQSVEQTVSQVVEVPAQQGPILLTQR